MPASGYLDWFTWNTSSVVNKRVAYTEFDGHWVSTDFFGIATHGPDKLFETMVFRGSPNDRPAYEQEMAVWRRATWDDAERQHLLACDWLRELIKCAGTLKPLH